MKKRKVTRVRPPNMLFPGLPNYKGPDRGWFAWVHHGHLFEHTTDDGDSIAERVKYVKKFKPKDERRIRLAHIMFLGNYVGRKLTIRQNVIHNTIHGGRIEHDTAAKDMVYRYIAKHKPRNKWDPSASHHGSLRKANGWVMTG